MTSNFKYDGTRVNTAVEDVHRISNQFATLSTNIRSATNKIVSARGFQQYVGGLSSDTFSSYVEQCGAACTDLSRRIRQQEVDILAYSKDSRAINAFVDRLTNNEYRSLDLSGIDSYISWDHKAGKFLRGVGSTLATAGLGLVEGIADFGETGADLVRLGGTLLASIFTKGYDVLTGSNVTEKMWEATRAEVSQKKVESAFTNFYNNTSIGQAIKENAYGFDTVRGVGKGLGYTAGVIGLTVLTGGLVSGGIGAAGSITAGNLAATAGVMGFSNGTEEAWADGATTGKGLLYGAATGLWEGAQWYAGAKINQFGGLGDRVAKGIFKGAASGVGTRIFMDTVDSGLEGFVQPALTMIYKDYEGASVVDKYKTAFEAAGGWSNVATHAAIGAVGSAIGEFSGARRLLKEANQADASAGVKTAGAAGAVGAGAESADQIFKSTGVKAGEVDVTDSIAKLGADNMDDAARKAGADVDLDVRKATDEVAAAATPHEKIKYTDIDRVGPFDEQLSRVPAGMEMIEGTGIPKEYVLKDIFEIYEYGETFEDGLKNMENIYGPQSVQVMSARSLLAKEKIMDLHFELRELDDLEVMGVPEQAKALFDAVGLPSKDHTFDIPPGGSTISTGKTVFADDIRYWESLTPEEIRPMDGYSGGTYSQIGPSLRTGSDLPDSLAQEVGILSRQLESRPGLSERTIMYRGTDSLGFIDESFKTMSPEETVAAINKMANGTIVVGDNSFGSSTPFKSGGFTDKKVLEVCSVAPGTKGAYLGIMSHNGHESEYLLQAGVGNRKIILGADFYNGQIILYTAIP